MASEEERCIGCLLGGAIGDALGAPWVGMTRAELAGHAANRDFVAASQAVTLVMPLPEQGETETGDPLQAGQWTDDTQLTLALAETLIEENGLFVPEAWAHKLARWLSEEPRAPGLSSLHAAMQLRGGGLEWHEAADPEGAGCGAATRVAPIALLFADAPERRREAAIAQAQVTHGHPDARAASLLMVEAISRALALSPSDFSNGNGAEFLGELIAAAQEASPEFAEMARCLTFARALLEDGVEKETAIRALGVSAWSRETVPCALYLFARDPHDVETLLLDSVFRTGGATESIAALTGALAGALHGVEALPLRWREGVEDAERISRTALALSYTRRDQQPDFHDREQASAFIRSFLQSRIAR